MVGVKEVEDLTELKKTPLYDLHIKNKAKMVPFAGYAMPVQYQDGIVAEHNHCRKYAGLFDVSHMGQCCFFGKNVAKIFEEIVPSDFVSLSEGKQKYTLLTNQYGGIEDDLMVANLGDYYYAVVNASRKDNDFAYMNNHFSGKCDFEIWADRALLALQGPYAGEVMAKIVPQTIEMKFMDAARIEIEGLKCIVTRTGYTGEDGFEISVKADKATELAELILKDDNVKLIGLGARDTLRLEAGLCLYGNDINQHTSPIEANLKWAVSKSRRENGGFVGDKVILQQLESGVSKLLVGVKPVGKAPARAHTPILSSDGIVIGEITSGTFSPTLSEPIAMGYVNVRHANSGTKVFLEVRGKQMDAEVVALPFVAHNYKR